MAILVIDNGSRYLEQLLALLRPWSPHIQPYGQIKAAEAERYAGIVLSGGHGPAVEWDPNAYQKELELVKNTSKPIIGICLGCELIGHAFGATLQELPAREHGRVTIQVVESGPIFPISTFEAIENHRWVIRVPGAELVPLATSKDGIEVIRHRERPIYGFQFHPELDDADGIAARIFLDTIEHLGIQPADTVFDPKV